MRIRQVFVVLAALIVLLPTPSWAQAEEPDNYFTVYLARNSGGDLFDGRSSTTGFGGAFTFWGRGIASAELDFGYSPEFLDKDDVGRDNSLLTLTLSGVFGPWLGSESHRVRPYAVVGGGLMRSKLREFAILGADSRNRGVLDIGGGVLYLANSRIGVRGDVRYMQGVGEKNDEDGWGILDEFNYIRGSVGVSFGF